MRTTQFSLFEGIKVGAMPLVMIPDISVTEVVATLMRPLDNEMFRYIAGDKFPDGYEIVNPAQNIPKMPDEVNDAMKKLTPQQREIMKSLGLDKFMPK
jgi:hypothetical protein